MSPLNSVFIESISIYKSALSNVDCNILTILITLCEPSLTFVMNCIFQFCLIHIDVVLNSIDSFPHIRKYWIAILVLCDIRYTASEFDLSDGSSIVLLVVLVLLVMLVLLVEIILLIKLVLLVELILLVMLVVLSKVLHVLLCLRCL